VLFLNRFTSSLKLSLPSLEMVDDLLMVNNGALAEKFFGQHLLYDGPRYEKPQFFYWNREQKNPSAEVDYLMAHSGTVVPVFSMSIRLYNLIVPIWRHTCK